MASIPPSLAVVYGSDPGMFVVNVVKQSKSVWATLARRVSDRGGIKNWKAPGGNVTINLAPSDDASVNEIALAVVGNALKFPLDFADEGARMALNQPRGLAGDVRFYQQTRKFRSSVDPATITAVAGLLAVCVPVIIAIANVALPIVLSFFQGGMDSIPGPDQKPGNKPKPPKPPADPPTDAVPIALGLGALAWVFLR